MLRAVHYCRHNRRWTAYNSYPSLSLLASHNLCGLGTYNDFTSQPCRSLASRAGSATHFYDVLGLTPNATQKQIKTAYYDLSKQCHPDVNPSSDSHRMFTQISEAYETLGNLTKKRAYDRGLRNPAFDHGPDVDMTEEYFRQRTSAFHGRKPPPTGRTRQYDFDEFYKQHYADQIRAEQRRRLYEHEHSHYMKALQKQRMYMRNMMLSIMMFWMAAGFVISISNHEDPGRRR